MSAVPRAAATVVLLRDAAEGLEAYLLRRHDRMLFAAGMYAFPGGAVDPRDADESIGWTGPSPAHWATRLGCPVDLARSLVCAAVRETFEESGVLLAGPGPDTVVGDTTAPGWEADRATLSRGELPLAGMLGQRRLVLRADLLGAWARWVTPASEPRRYDAWFFVAALPPGQLARDVSGEADQVCWVRPAAAVGGAAEGRMRMLPPTSATLAELARFDRVADVLAASVDRPLTVSAPRTVTG